MMTTKQEKPKLTGYRMYARHRNMIRKFAKRRKVSDAQIVRDAIEQYAATHGVA